MHYANEESRVESVSVCVHSTDEGAVEEEGSGVRKRLRIYPRQVQLMPLLARGSFARAVDGVQKAQQKNPKKARAKITRNGNQRKRRHED